MFKPKISFKTKKWTCEICGLPKEISKWKIKIGDKVYFQIKIIDRNFNFINNTITGLVADRKNKYLVIFDLNNNTYFVDQKDVFLKDSPASFLFNMYGKCNCNEIKKL